jgi:type IV secretory pathway component VirB8
MRFSGMTAAALCRLTQAKKDLYLQEEEKRQVEESDRQLKEAQQLSEAQSRRPATITEVAITIFVLLCGVAVAAFLRVKRQRAPQ